MNKRPPHHKKTLNVIIISLFLVFLMLAMFFFTKDNFGMGMLSLIGPFALVFIVFLIASPQAGFISVLVANYFAIGLARYVPGPLGLSLDGILVLTWVAIIFSQFNRKVEWRKAKNLLTLLTAVWFSYTLFQLFNPEAVSRVAWFYAMRGVSLYMLLSVPLVFVLFNTPKHMQLFVKLWAYFTLIAVAKGMMQKFVGPDPWENRWLDLVGGKTHRLPGGLRIFSFFADSATYGGAMGFSGVAFAVMALNTNIKKERLFFMAVAGAAFFGMLISGTRGAMAVPFAGFTMYLLLSKKIKMVVTGAVLMMSIYGILKYTDIGSSVYEIRRFRNALDPDNPSLMVRKENQKKFKVYLASRPFGGGIGSAGNWGLRFSPGTFLAETPPDGWYVQIWAEQGIVGLLLYLGILFTIIGKCAYLIFLKLKNQYYISRAMAFCSGMFGVMAASYSSSALGQMPNVLIIYMGVAFVFLMPSWEEEEALEARNRNTEKPRETDTDL